MYQPRLCALVLLALSGTAFGQQPAAPAVVQVEGLGEVLATLQRIEQGVALLLTSRWEYLFLQRNRLKGFGDLDAEITALGREGWELVGVTVEEGFILKRRVLR